MILKLSLLCLLLSVNSYAISVLIAKESINFEEKIDSSTGNLGISSMLYEFLTKNKQ